MQSVKRNNESGVFAGGKRGERRKKGKEKGKERMEEGRKEENGKGRRIGAGRGTGRGAQGGGGMCFTGVTEAGFIANGEVAAVDEVDDQHIAVLNRERRGGARQLHAGRVQRKRGKKKNETESSSKSNETKREGGENKLESKTQKRVCVRWRSDLGVGVGGRAKELNGGLFDNFDFT